MNAHQQYIQQQQQYFQQQYLQQQKMMNNAKHFEQAQTESHQHQNLNQAALSQQKESLRANAQIHGQKKPSKYLQFSENFIFLVADDVQTINNQIKNNEKNFQQNLQNKNEKKQITQTNQAIKLPEESIFLC